MRRYDKLQNKQQQRTGEKKKTKLTFFLMNFTKKMKYSIYIVVAKNT